jgi:hypothetical protein
LFVISTVEIICRGDKWVKLEGASFVSKSKTWVDFAEEARGHRVHSKKGIMYPWDHSCYNSKLDLETTTNGEATKFLIVCNCTSYFNLHV